VASLAPVPGSNPNPGLSWSLTGTGCSAATCGILQVTTTQSAEASKIDDTATYIAPPTAPQPDLVTVTVTSLADPTKKAQANISIQPGSGLGISPLTATLSVNHRITFSASGGAATGNLTWSVGGIPGGSASLGQICVVAFNPCQSFSSGPAQQVDFVAPGAIPSINPGRRRVGRNGTGANSRRGHLFKSQRHLRILRHATSSCRESEILRFAIASDPRTGTRAGFQSFECVERNDVSLRADAGHIRGAASHHAATRMRLYPMTIAPGCVFCITNPTIRRTSAPFKDASFRPTRYCFPPLDPVLQEFFSLMLLLSIPQVAAWSLGGWSCQASGPVQFDGSYEIDGLAVGRSYKVYAEPLNGAAGPSTVTNDYVPLCRNSITDPGWPPLQSCVVPSPDLEFTTRSLP
jgi:hypothetical protein